MGREIRRFLVVGTGAVGTDFAVYCLLLATLSHSLAKTLSFVCGTIVAYLLNKHWTFAGAGRSYVEMLRFFLLYSTTLVVNVTVNKVSLILVPEVNVAFVAATGTSTVLNFIGQKFWVFR